MVQGRDVLGAVFFGVRLELDFARYQMRCLAGTVPRTRQCICIHYLVVYVCLQSFDAVGWAAGRASDLKKLSGELLVWLSVWSEVQMIWIWSS